MAELPPKIPSTAPSDHHTVEMGNSTQNQPWVEEFLNFSAAKRNAHRTFSDEIAFFEAPPLMVEKCDSSSVTLTSHNDDQFEGFDDEQLLTMFSDDHHHRHHHHHHHHHHHQHQHIPGTSASTTSNTVPHQTMSSASSDRNSINDSDDQKPLTHEVQCHDRDHKYRQILKNESGEVESPCRPDIPIPATSTGDPIRDPKRVKRILANRQSAQRSRVRKLQYISELERSVTSLQTEVSALSPRVAYLDHQRLVLNVDNSALKQRIAALAQDKIFKDAHQEALKKEIERLRQVMYQQQQQNLEKMSKNSTTSTYNININDHAQILVCNKDKEASSKEEEIREKKL